MYKNNFFFKQKKCVWKELWKNLFSQHAIEIYAQAENRFKKPKVTFDYNIYCR